MLRALVTFPLNDCFGQYLRHGDHYSFHFAIVVEVVEAYHHFANTKKLVCIQRVFR